MRRRGRPTRGSQRGSGPIVHRDDRHIVFLPNFHALHGCALVAPVEHREAVASDFTEDEYLGLQWFVRQVALALERTVPTERIYVLSLDSARGNAHDHWHVAALPPGVPYEDQQFRALMVEPPACSTAVVTTKQ